LTANGNGLPDELPDARGRAFSLHHLGGWTNYEGKQCLATEARAPVIMQKLRLLMVEI